MKRASNMRGGMKMEETVHDSFFGDSESDEDDKSENVSPAVNNPSK